MIALARGAHDDAIEIATEEVARSYCQPKGEHLRQVGKGKVDRYAQIEERVCHTMGETTIDEDGDTKEHGEILAFASKGHYRGHDETASDGQYTASEGT